MKISPPKNMIIVLVLQTNKQESVLQKNLHSYLTTQSTHNMISHSLTRPTNFFRTIFCRYIWKTKTIV